LNSGDRGVEPDLDSLNRGRDSNLNRGIRDEDSDSNSSVNNDENSDQKNANSDDKQHISWYSEDDAEIDTDGKDLENEEQKPDEEAGGNISMRRIDAQEKADDPQLLEALREF
jgi:hypothetical protein